ncbi:MAG: hypothetical protein AAGD18_18055 [Actinomycetota bacterium]
MHRLRLPLIAGLLVVLGACSSGSSTESLTVEVDEDSGEIEISTDTDPTTTTILVVGSDAPPDPGGDAPASTVDAELELPDGVGSDGVLVAAVVLATGDIEAALDAGLVTPAEVEAAVQAIQDGSLPDIVG